MIFKRWTGAFSFSAPWPTKITEMYPECVIASSRDALIFCWMQRILNEGRPIGCRKKNQKFNVYANYKCQDKQHHTVDMQICFLSTN